VAIQQQVLKKQDGGRFIWLRIETNGRALVNTIMNLQIPWNDTNFVSGWATSGFSWSTQLHGISYIHFHFPANFRSIWKWLTVIRFLEENGKYIIFLTNYDCINLNVWVREMLNYAIKETNCKTNKRGMCYEDSLYSTQLTLVWVTLIYWYVDTKVLCFI
jgi:hypothetical protein